MRQFKLDLIYNDEYHKVLFIFSDLMNIINNQYDDHELALQHEDDTDTNIKEFQITQ